MRLTRVLALVSLTLFVASCASTPSARTCGIIGGLLGGGGGFAAGNEAGGSAAGAGGAVLGGVVVGILIGHGLVVAISTGVEAQASISIGFFDTAPNFVPFGFQQLQLNWELVLIPMLIGLAAVAGYIPGMTAYRTDVAKSLSATP